MRVEKNIRSLSRGIPLGSIFRVWLLFFCCVPATCHSQDGLDVVVVRRHDKPGETLERRGVIHNWRGIELEMETSGTTRRVSNDDIVEVRTIWPEPWTEAELLIRQRRFGAAVDPLQQALAEETRPWAQAILRERLIRIHDLLGQPEPAAEQFLQLLADDPETRLFAAIPLAWNSVTVSARLQQASEKWMASRIPAVRLMGASWLLGTPQRDQATVVLKELSLDIDSKIAHLATAQLWRTEWISADAQMLGRWEQQIERMPGAIRPGPLTQFAAAQERLELFDQAIISLMKVPILYPENLVQSLASLERAAGLLSKQNREQEAARVRAEMSASFPDKTGQN